MTNFANEAAQIFNQAPAVANPPAPDTASAFVLNVEDNGDLEFQPVSSGLHDAYLFGLVNLGIHKAPEQFGGKLSTKIMLLFEILDEKRMDGTAHICTVTLTMSLFEKSNLYKFIVGMTGTAPTENFDLRTLVGRNAVLNIAHKISKKNRKYAMVHAAMKPKANSVFPTGENQNIIYDANSEHMPIYNELPKWVQEMCDRRLNADGTPVHPEAHVGDK